MNQKFFFHAPKVKHPSKNLENSRLLLEQHLSLPVLIGLFSMTLNKQHQISYRENAQIESSLFQTNNYSSIKSTNKCQT